MFIELVAGPCDGMLLEATEPLRQRIQVDAPVSMHAVLSDGYEIPWESVTYEIVLRDHGHPALRPERSKSGAVRYRFVPES